MGALAALESHRRRLWHWQPSELCVWLGWLSGFVSALVNLQLRRGNRDVHEGVASNRVRLPPLPLSLTISQVLYGLTPAARVPRPPRARATRPAEYSSLSGPRAQRAAAPPCPGLSGGMEAARHPRTRKPCMRLRRIDHLCTCVGAQHPRSRANGNLPRDAGPRTSAARQSPPRLRRPSEGEAKPSPPVIQPRESHK